MLVFKGIDFSANTRREHSVGEMVEWTNVLDAGPASRHSWALHIYA